MIAIVLAGGASSRLWPLRDKSLIRLGGESLLARTVGSLCDAGAGRIVVVASGANAEAIRAEVGRMDATVLCQVAVQDARTPGIGAGVIAAVESLGAGGDDRRAIVTHAHAADTTRLFRNLVAASDAAPGGGVLAGRAIPEDSYFDGGYLLLDGPDGRAGGITEKPGPGSVPPGRMATIMAHAHPDIVRLAEAVARQYEGGGETDDHYERAVSVLCWQDEYRVLPYDGPWRPLKHPWDLLEAADLFLAGVARGIDAAADVSEGARVAGPVWVGPGARIMWGADIEGPAWIGPGAVVGQFSVVRDSMVGAGAVVGTGSEVVRSYLGDGARLHAARVLDSVVAGSEPGVEPANLSAGSVTANLRIDGAEVRSWVSGSGVGSGRRKLGAIIGAGAFVAVNAALMPGVKLGERAVVLPGAVVRRDVSDGATAGRGRGGSE